MRDRTLIEMSYSVRSIDLDFSKGIFHTSGWMTLEWQDPRYGRLEYPILDTRISFVRSFVRSSVTLVLPPLISEMGWTGELWSKTKFLILEN